MGGALCNGSHRNRCSVVMHTGGRPLGDTSVMRLHAASCIVLFQCISELSYIRVLQYLSQIIEELPHTRA